MDYTLETEGTRCLITIQGAFTFVENEAFLALAKTLESSSSKTIIIDLSEVAFIDSAALGMLLLLREEQEKQSRAIVLRHAKGQVQKMFALSKFNELFILE